MQLSSTVITALPYLGVTPLDKLSIMELALVLDDFQYYYTTPELLVLSLSCCFSRY